METQADSGEPPKSEEPVDAKAMFSALNQTIAALGTAMDSHGKKLDYVIEEQKGLVLRVATNENLIGTVQSRLNNASLRAQAFSETDLTQEALIVKEKEEREKGQAELAKQVASLIVINGSVLKALLDVKEGLGKFSQNRTVRYIAWGVGIIVADWVSRKTGLR